MTRILGYADRVSATPGETIRFMVSCDNIDRYDAELVRVIQGDINPAGPGYREEVIPHDFGGPISGRHQPIHPGSYGLVPDNPAFRALTSLGVLAAIWPTMPGDGPQTILSRQDPASGAGFRLVLDEQGTLSFELRSRERGAAIVSTGKPLLAEP